jgi:hypothetical protein
LELCLPSYSTRLLTAYYCSLLRHFLIRANIAKDAADIREETDLGKKKEIYNNVRRRCLLRLKLFSRVNTVYKTDGTINSLKIELLQDATGECPYFGLPCFRMDRQDTHSLFSLSLSLCLLLIVKS